MFSGNTSQVSDGRLYIEDVFSTWLYTGTGAAQTITNGINISGQGGMVWIKSRSAATNNFLFDTTRGVNVEINSNTTDANATLANSLTAFNANGFSISSAAGVGTNADTYASWTFREAPKFFDVVTYTGTGANRTIAHNLGVAPGCIIVKRTDTTADWQVYHRSNANTQYMVLNLTDAVATGTTRWNSTTPTATEFTVGTDATVNASGGTYVAYLFAHDATSDGVIQCGSYVGTGNFATAPVINLGWEPQWLLTKCVDSGTARDDWFINDTMRGLNAGTGATALMPNETTTEQQYYTYAVTSTGFRITTSDVEANRNGNTYIYIAIRRGPMKTPTLGTSVFSPTLATFSGSTVTNTGFVVDMAINKNGVATASNNFVLDRLRGSDNGANQQTISTNGTSAEVASSGRVALTGSVTIQNGFLEQNTAANNIVWAFARAPGFFDEVCWTATGAVQTINHNLGVVPELIIAADRSLGQTKPVGGSILPNTNYLVINTNAASASGYPVWNNTSPTSTTFTVGNAVSWINNTGDNNVAWLFASCPGVSKVGSYTGNGSSQTINCGFAAGSRFVLIKRTDSTGDWYVWDTARGIVAGNDPHLSLNTTAAEVTTDDTIDTDSSGFVVNQVAATNVNVSSATYIYLAIA